MIETTATETADTVATLTEVTREASDAVDALNASTDRAVDALNGITAETLTRQLQAAEARADDAERRSAEAEERQAFWRDNSIAQAAATGELIELGKRIGRTEARGSVGPAIPARNYPLAALWAIVVLSTIPSLVISTAIVLHGLGVIR